MQNGQKRDVKPRDPDMVGAEAAIVRAAIKARRRALATTGSYPVSRNGEIVYVTELIEPTLEYADNGMAEDTHPG